MKYLQSKANKTVKLVLEWELSRVIFKYILANNLLPFAIRQFAIMSLAVLPIQSSLTHHKFRCPITGQPRSILTFFKLNRMRFKMMANTAQLTGIKKNSW